MHRNQSVNVHQFAMVPRADIPRSKFRMQKAIKTTFNAGYLVPIFCEEVLPGDAYNVKFTGFGRLATPIYPVMDNMYLETFFFFVPNRLVWDNWEKFMGQQDNLDDPIDYTIPQVVSKVSGYDLNSVFDHFGLPIAGQIQSGKTYSHSALPLRGYNLIYNEWFRDENLHNAYIVAKNDGPDDYNNYSLHKRGKRHDYFTSCLPFLQKGQPVNLPLGSFAPVVPDTAFGGTGTPDWQLPVGAGGFVLGPLDISNSTQVGAHSVPYPFNEPGPTDLGAMSWREGINPSTELPYTGLAVDLATATSATINQIRQAFQIQRLLERDARGGTRYTEIVRAHFGVISPDARLQRPEYLGGGSSYINISPIAQTSQTDTTPLGTLSAFGTVTAHGHGFSQSFTEHGYIIGVCSVRADLAYQQGLRRHWSRETRYDFYFPAFAMLGEQAVLEKEIYCTGEPTIDETVFGYQERWAEYRYNPSEITSYFRSGVSGTLDAWHLAQYFGLPPVLNSEFIDENPPVDRIVAVQGEDAGPQFILDGFYDNVVVRPLPMYSVPGLVDHF